MTVKAKKKIEQCPLSDAPDVPAGTLGTIEDKDYCCDLLLVDFGEPYGVILCAPTEVG